MYPQEVIFRAFFVRRYGDALRGLGGRWALVGAGAAAFGWAHVLFGPTTHATIIAVALSTVGVERRPVDGRGSPAALRSAPDHRCQRMKVPLRRSYIACISSA